MEEMKGLHQSGDRLSTNPVQATSDRSPVCPSHSTHPINNDEHIVVENGEPAAAGRNQMIKKGASLVLKSFSNLGIGQKFSETVKGKKSSVGVGAKKIKRDGVSDGENKLVKTYRCKLSTTIGPIAGTLSIYTLELTFCSKTPITVPSSSGENLNFPYKVRIPVKKIKAVNESYNEENQSQKYIEIVSVDDFEFWFMEVESYKEAVVNLHSSTSDQVDPNLIKMHAHANYVSTC